MERDREKPEASASTRGSQPKKSAPEPTAPETGLDDSRAPQTDPRPAPAQPGSSGIPVSTHQLEEDDDLAGYLAVGLADDPTGGSRSELKPGATFGQYQLIRELGRGGMGAVFLARDTRLGRRVAVKFLTHADTSLAARFRAEARATARCKHDNIIDIYDVGEQHGHSYMVLEYIKGTTLRAWLTERWQPDTLATLETPVSQTLAAESMLPVVRALVHAHKQGLVHRDLKPENIMLADSGRLMVLDFGIAKALEDDVLANGTFEQTNESRGGLGVNTGAGALIGTMPYMSPEQWEGLDLDGRSDVWAVGIMLWELCTGRHPLEPLSQARLMAVADLDRPMPLMSERHPHLQPLADVIDRCLCKRAAERMSSAAALLEELERLTSRDTEDAAANTTGEPDNPFLALAAFQRQDAARFFGRDRDIARLMSQLRNHRMVTVAGASGAGKSSLLRAGVIPALLRSGQKWEIFIVRPGRHPLTALARVALDIARTMQPDQHTPGTREEVADKLRAQPGYLGTRLRAFSQGRQTRVLLVVDQFEELYTLGADRDIRAAFVACLEGVADDASSPLRVALSMRSDFFDRVAEDRAFTSELTEAFTLLAPMQRAELRAALTRPLDAVGHGFESEALIDDILDDLEAANTPLPLLQFTASQLWERRDREARQITQASYDALGGIAGALANHADAVLASMATAEQKLARMVCTALVSEERTRAIVSLDELRAQNPAQSLVGQGEAVEQCVQRLAGARLVLIENDDDGATVELVHESLITRWPTLRRWLDEGAEDSEFLARLRSAAKAWGKRDKAEGMLWAGEVAREAKQWHERYQGELPRRDTAFLQAVFTTSERAARRKRRLVYGAMAALAVVAVSATVGVLVVLQKQRAAEKSAAQAKKSESQAKKSEAQAKKSESQAKEQALTARKAVRIAAAKGLVKRDPDTSLRMLRQVEAADPGADILDWYATMQASASRSSSFDRDWLKGHKGGVNSALFSVDGTQLVTASADKTARVWTLDSDDGTWTGQSLEGHEGGVNSAVFSVDGTQLVTASADKTARVWTLGKDNRWTGQPLEGHEDGVRSAGFSPDGNRVVTASWDKTARVWTRGPDNTWTAQSTGQSLGGHEGGVRSALFSPGGTRVVTTASWDKTARVWTLGDDNIWTGQPLEGHEGSVNSAVFSADGTRVVTASVDKTARVWTQSHGRWTGQSLEGHQGIVHSAVFSADGTRVVSASGDRTARVWTLGDDNQWTAQSLEGHEGPVNSAVFSADGTRVVTVSTDKTARVWTQSQDRWSARSLEGHEDRVNSAAFSPDGRRVVTASRDGRARVWLLANEDLVPRLWREVADCLPVEKRRALLGETGDTARLNRDACQACVAYYQEPDARFPCPYRADADLLATGSEGQPRPVPGPDTEAGPTPTSEAGVIVPPTVRIPGGRFQMGSKDTETGRRSDEGPMHEVEVSTFWMCETEITQGQWTSVMVENAEPSTCTYGCSDRHPVQNVHWFDAIEYLNRLSASQGLEACYEHDGGEIRWKSGPCNGYRLPTESEWEYAARAGATTVYSFGDDVDELEKHAWYSANADNKAHAVGTKLANNWLLYDMHGNVWEWVWDWHSARYPSGLQKNPTGQKHSNGRVLRGGSVRDVPRDVRSAFRLRSGPMGRGGDLGFRCARGRPPQRAPPAVN